MLYPSTPIHQPAQLIGATQILRFATLDDLCAALELVGPRALPEHAVIIKQYAEQLRAARPEQFNRSWFDAAPGTTRVVCLVSAVADARYGFYELVAHKPVAPKEAK